MEIFQAENQNPDGYLKERLVPLLAASWADRATLYARFLPDSSVYLGLYETERWDMEDFPTASNQLVAAARNFTIVTSGVFRRCGPPVRPERSGFMTSDALRRPVTGLLLTMSVCGPSTAARTLFTPLDRTPWEFNNWYNRKWLPAEIGWGTVQAGYRYAATETDPVDEARLFLALYETGHSDPKAAVDEHLRRRQLDPPAEPFNAARFLGDFGFVPVAERLAE